MRIQDMFEKDINREIHGVVKVAQEDDANLKQELEEYVVTDELACHFRALFDSYERAVDHPTDKIGVWISGFFGSGKSHFLKILSYLLENREVAGKSALDYFDGKFDDPALYGQARRCAQVPAEAILFNIDNKNVGAKDRDALKRTFARVFYDHLGFYGEDLKLARLEKYIDDKGKTDAFRARYRELTGEGWVETRETYVFNSDEVIAALAETGVMSEDEAERYLAGSEQVDFSIDALTNEIAAYARKRASESGGQFRLLFMVDEVGQYVNNGRDVDLMLNLQTIVEELGAKGAGSVWVMVTSQEAIDEVVDMAGISNDFSKIQGRFDTRLSLSSASADEVIKRRVLAKNEYGADQLRAQYAQQEAGLKNLFHFKSDVGGLIGYEDAEDFVQTFPFAGYQFKIMQKVLSEVRKHGSSGKHLSGGERSMLSGFQEAAQAVEDRDEFTLVPFWRFYDTVQTFLEGHVRRVINNAAENVQHCHGLEPIDVRVLKTLFLIRWIDKDIPGNAENVAILMVERMDQNLMDLRQEVTQSLQRLVKQNFAGRTGETYRFLTDDEQEIARAIANTPVDPARVTERIGQIVFGNIFETPKLKYGENYFDVEKYVDETRVGAPGGLRLRVMTAASSEGATSHEALLQRSFANEAICLLSDDARYYTLVQHAARIEQFANTQNVSQQPENVQRIIKDRRAEAQEDINRAQELLEEGIRHGDFYACGQAVRPEGTTGRQMLSSALAKLVVAIYPKLGLIDKNYDASAELLEILHGTRALDGLQPNAGAIEEMERYLAAQARLSIDTTMAEVQKTFQAAPYGWREIDVAAVAAELLAQQKARLTYAGAAVDITDAKCIDRLRKATDTQHTVIKLRVNVPEPVRKRVRDIVIDITGSKSVPLEEKDLAATAWDGLRAKLGDLEELLRTQYARGGYPGRLTVEYAIASLKDALAAGSDPSDLLPRIADAEDDLLDSMDDLAQVEGFFPTQQEIWDKAQALMRVADKERDYLRGDPDASQACKTLADILGMERPYSRIHEITPARQRIKEAYSRMLKAKRDGLIAYLEDIYASIEDKERSCAVSLPAVGQRRLARRDTVHGSESLTELDALRSKLEGDQAEFFAKIQAEADARQARTRTPPPRAGAGGNTPRVPQPSAKPLPKIRNLNRTVLFSPETLRSEEDIDRYLAAARKRMVEGLAGSDGIKIQ